MQAPTTMPTTTQTTTSSSTSKPRIRRIGETRYLIESKSSPGLGRQVDVHTGRCSCPAGRHARSCWHLKWARDYHAWREAQLALGAIRVAAPQAPSVPAPQQTAELVALWSLFE